MFHLGIILAGSYLCLLTCGGGLESSVHWRNNEGTFVIDVCVLRAEFSISIHYNSNYQSPSSLIVILLCLVWPRVYHGLVAIR